VDHLRSWDDLPPNARAYVKRVEELVGVKVMGVSVGADRGQTILRENPFRA
jgi:adenylosuccinate synthase